MSTLEPSIDYYMSASEKAGLLKSKISAMDAWPLFVTQKNADRAVLLYSGGDSAQARHHILGLKPSQWFTAQCGHVEIGGIEAKKFKTQDPVSAAFEWIEAKKKRSEDLPFFFPGGAIGYFSYDVCSYIEKLPGFAKQHCVPEISLLCFDELWVYDVQTQELYFLWQSDSGLSLVQASDKFKRVLQLAPQLKKQFPMQAAPRKIEIHPLPLMTKTEFLKAVEHIKRYIANGDVFQVNLSQRYEITQNVSPLHVFQSLMDINPSPFFSYFQTPEMTLVCGSPERLVQRRGAHIQTRPIAGTRPRSADSVEDLRLSAELLLSEKERAEHVMLVDLERNDLGKVCQPGSVSVTEMMKVEQYSHVQHIVSNITGTLRPNISPEMIFRAMFPGGTITGTPKVRAMEIIAELEPISRGSYTGSLGWIGYNHNMDLNIIIRSLEWAQGRINVQVGAGIVADSDPQMEYGETIEKAKAMLSAVEWSG